MEGTLYFAEGRPTLRFQRRLAHPPEKVWRAISDPAELVHWFPSAVEINLRLGGAMRFTFPQDHDVSPEGQVVELEPGRILAYTWGGDVLRFELQPDGPGCLLTFAPRIDDRPLAASYASGWQTCLDRLDTLLNGSPSQTPPYPELHAGYLDAFGLAEGSVQETAEGWTVRFDRQIAETLEKVWAQLSGAKDSDSATDAPTVGDASPPAAGDANVPAVGGSPPVGFTNPYVTAGPVTAVQPPTLLEYAWEPEGQPVGRVRWELRAHPGGAVVGLTQSGPSDLADRRAIVLAAWHTHLEILAEHFKGRTICPWPEARTAELEQHYARLVEPAV